MPATSSASQKSSVTGDGGLSVSRRYTEAGTHPFDMVEWEIRDAIIGNPEKPAFEQRGVEFPTTWSQNATNIVAQKYFRGQMNTPERESSVKQMVGRVAGTISGWGREAGYFATEDDADAFEAELRRLESEPIAGPDQLSIDVLQPGGVPSVQESTLASPSGGRSKSRQSTRTTQRRSHASH